MTAVPDRTRRFVDRVRAAEGADGRLPALDQSANEIFPFDGELRVRPVDEPVLPEPARTGTGGTDCWACRSGADRAVWADERWVLVPEGPAAMPVVLLWPRAHHDLVDLPAELAADLGSLLVRIEAALLSLGGVGRVHVYRWGDGAEHFHLWFFARPEGVLQLRGSSLPDWYEALPPMPQDEWDAEMAQVARTLARGGGVALTPPDAEPSDP